MNISEDAFICNAIILSNIIYFVPPNRISQLTDGRSLSISLFLLDIVTLCVAPDTRRTNTVTTTTPTGQQLRQRRFDGN